MEESGGSLKRQREETTQGVEKEEEDEMLKRQKSYKDIITLLEQDEDEPTQDLSSLISTLQQEISSSSPEPGPQPYPDTGHVSAPYETDPDNLTTGSGSGSGSGSDEEERDKVIKHLLQASDDELGLPNTADVAVDGLDDLLGGQLDGEDFIFPLGGEGLWEFEDHEAVNYYSFLQSSQVFL